MKMPTIEKKDVIYVLIIANLVVWTISSVIALRFYNDYVSLLIQASQAKELSIDNQELKVVNELSTMDWIKGEWTKAGADWEQVWAIIQLESRWNQEAIHVNSNGSVDLGLYQLNSVHKISPLCALNVECSTKEAIKIWQKQGFTPWVAAKKLGL